MGLFFNQNYNTVKTLDSISLDFRLVERLINKFGDIIYADKDDNIFLNDLISDDICIGKIISNTEYYTISEINVNENFQIPFHLHEDSTEFFILVSGKIFIEVDNKLHCLEKNNNFLCVDKKLVHRLFTTDEKCKFIVFAVPPLKELSGV